MRTLIIAGVLLCAVPLLAQTDPVQFQLTETRAEVAKLLGPPKMVATFGDDFESWQYQIGPIEEEGFSHQLVFRKSTGTLISLARNYPEETNVDQYFPKAETTAYKTANFSVRVRKLPGARLIISMGPSSTTNQVFLILRSELPNFYPDLARQLH